MKNTKILASGLILTILISNIGSFISDGKKLDNMRENVLRLHILANSDSEYDQRLKLMVRDSLLESDIFKSAENIGEAAEAAEQRLSDIENIAEKTLSENGCDFPVHAYLTDMDFEPRVYGDITMPAGHYRTLRVEIGRADGHNWWCVMYPPLCIPAAYSVTDSKTAEECCFDDKELDIICNPEKYQVRFAIWDAIKALSN